MTGKKPWRKFRCRSCGSEFGWNGDYLDMPACPHCGYDMPESRKEEFQKDFDAMIKKSAEKTSKKKAVRKKATGKGGKKKVHRKKRRK